MLFFLIGCSISHLYVAGVLTKDQQDLAMNVVFTLVKLFNERDYTQIREEAPAVLGSLILALEDNIIKLLAAYLITAEESLILFL